MRSLHLVSGLRTADQERDWVALARAEAVGRAAGSCESPGSHRKANRRPEETGWGKNPFQVVLCLLPSLTQAPGDTDTLPDSAARIVT